MTQLSNVLITDDNQNKLSVMKTSDNCVFSKADLQAINGRLLFCMHGRYFPVPTLVVGDLYRDHLYVT